MSELYDLSVKDIKMNTVDLSSFKGKTLLIVNVASKCGFTPQYKDLQNLYDKYQDQDFEVLGFPCNQFGAQEPGTMKRFNHFVNSHTMFHLKCLIKLMLMALMQVLCLNT